MNDIDPFGLHGLILGGRGPGYVNVPRILRSPQRQIKPRVPNQQKPKLRHVNRPAPNPVKPSKWQKFWQDVSDLLGELGLGGLAGGVMPPDSGTGDPCGSDSEAPEYTEEDWEDCYRSGDCI